MGVTAPTSASAGACTPPPYAPPARGEERLFDRREYSAHDKAYVSLDFCILEPQHVIAATFEKFAALVVTFSGAWRIVYAAFKFNDELCAVADEINDEWADGRLLAPMRRADGEAPQFAPQRLLGGRHRSSHARA